MVFRAGVIGHPVIHSLSPVMHNAAYKYCGIDWSYDAVDLDPKGARQAIQDLFAEGYRGLNVTMPYKELACEISRPHGSAARLNSVNTLVSDDSGQLHGYSTDGEGFVRAVREKNVEINNATVMVIGSGAAARVICDALVHENAQVLIAARSLDKALAVVESIVSTNAEDRSSTPHIDVVEYSQRHERASDCSLVVNATPVGMTKDGKADPSTPLNVDALNESTFVFDTIYHPLETELLKQAREKGCEVSNGLPMLLHQGALAFSLMTRQDAPVDVMRQTLIDHIEGQ